METEKETIEVYINKLKKGIKNLNNLLSLSKMPFQIATETGHIAIEINPSPDFCKFFCQEEPTALCSGYKNHLNSAKNNDIFHFPCPMGLHNFIIPIPAPDADPRFYLLGGEVFREDTRYQKYMIPVEKLAKEKNIPKDNVARAISQIKTMETEQIELYEQMCKYIAHNLSESLYTPTNKIAKLSLEKEILEKKIIDLETKNSFLVINPHFLFNTLNTITRVAYYENAHKTEELLYCLSDLLRYNLKQDNSLHPLSEELENIKKYLYIQKVRFKNRLNYEIEIPESIQQYQIPNMILQPIIENALVHGITSKQDTGLIRVTAETSGDNFYIYISDNGHGFPTRVLNQLSKQRFTEIKTSTTRTGIGLFSTNKRIQYFFGNAYGLSVKHSDFTGSTVSLFLPIK